MFPEPKYAENVIAGVIFRHTFAWYVTEMEDWFLDLPKYEHAFLAVGHKMFDMGDYSERFDIAILNEETAERFLSYRADRRVPASALSEMMLVQRQMYEEDASLDSSDYLDDILDFAPCFLVDFDQRRFFSQYPEPGGFEDYVPDGWLGVYQNFISEIPLHERYWIVNGQDLFKQVFHLLT